MRVFSLAIPALLILSTASCSKAPVVNITTVPPATTDVAFTTAYDIDEGSALDLVIDPGVAGAVITSSTLPAHAVLQDGLFSFTPDYTQAGLYSITFTITSGATKTERTIGIRVLNVIHITTPALITVNEGAAAPDQTFTSADPTGTVVTYSADLSAAPGAKFDPVSGKLTFTPSFKWLDSKLGTLAILVTAEGQEVDTGKVRTSTAKVVYQINEDTSFKQELVPVFMIQTGQTGSLEPSPAPEIQSDVGHGCVGCHNGSGGAFAGMDFHPSTIHDQLVNHDVAANGINGSACETEGALGVKRVTPGDVTKSLWYMKITGTDGNGGQLPCGAQMPNGITYNFLTVSDQDAWEACPPSNTDCKNAVQCKTTDLDCKLNARLIRKARVWIEKGALDN